ncbi:L-fuculose phosphate aldolase, partial [Dysosmobacter welbionis]
GDRHPEHPGHLQQLPVRVPDALQHVQIHRREHHQGGDQQRQVLRREEDQRQDDEGHHRHRFHHRHQGAQQVPDPLETGRQRCQHRRQRAGQEKAPQDAEGGEGHRLPEGRRARQGQQPPQRLHRRGQQQHPPAGGSRQGQTGPLPHQQPEGRRPQPDRACSPLHLPPPFSWKPPRPGCSRGAENLSAVTRRNRSRRWAYRRPRILRPAPTARSDSRTAYPSS